MVYIVNIDGASRGNPGNSSIGVVIKDGKGNIIKEISKCIGVVTNNQAEYKALIKALEFLKEAKENITIYTDSQLLERQWNGVYKVKNEDIRKLFNHAKEIARGLKINIVSVERDQNKEADTLANKALDNQKTEDGRQKTDVGADPCVRPNKTEVREQKVVDEVAAGFSLRNDKQAASDNILDEEEFDVQTQKSAGGIVYKKEGKKIKILLISKKGGGVWALPKGRIEKGEDEAETAKREIHEETGFRCEVKEKIDEVSYSFLLKEENVFYNKNVVFYLMPVMSDIQDERDAEADEVRWFTIGDALSKITYLSEKKILTKAKGLLII